MIKNEKKYSPYASKHNSTLEKHVVFFNGSKRRRMVLSCSKKKLSALIRGVTSKHHGDFYCLNCLYSFLTEKKLNLIKSM